MATPPARPRDLTPLEAIHEACVTPLFGGGRRHCLDAVPAAACECFDEQAPLYAARYAFGAHVFHSGSTDGLYRTVNDLALSRLAPDARVRVLDVGCGAGRTVLDFARYLKRGVVLGVDTSTHMLEYARKIVLEDGRALAMAVLATS